MSLQASYDIACCCMARRSQQTVPVVGVVDFECLVGLVKPVGAWLRASMAVLSYYIATQRYTLLGSISHH